MENRILRNAKSDTALLISALQEETKTTKVVPIEEVICECCGLKEDCSYKYIEQVKGVHSGRWVCGLCSEAVKDMLMQDQSPKVVMRDALSLHKQFCQEFKTTTMNPKLSLTCAMRDIARKSFQHRVLSKGKSSVVSKLARSSSCVPRIDH